MGRTLVLVTICLVLSARDARAYSVLTHEAIVDAAWDDAIVPVLRARFRPSADELLRARAFSYGGCLIQDLGYYPFSSRLFGDLTHYVRSGDFVEALVREARNTEELAFALGALAHYAADNVGHPSAVNLAVPITYPKLRAKFGDRVTYQDHPTAHLRTELGFDVLQIARGRYLPDAYRDFIGFEVSKPVLERAFSATYGLDLDDVFTNLGLAIGTFRWTVSTTIPEITKVAWESRYDEIAALAPGVTREQFMFRISRADYERLWGTEYQAAELLAQAGRRAASNRSEDRPVQNAGVPAADAGGREALPRELYRDGPALSGVRRGCLAQSSQPRESELRYGPPGQSGGLPSRGRGIRPPARQARRARVQRRAHRAAWGYPGLLRESVGPGRDQKREKTAAEDPAGPRRAPKNAVEMSSR